MLLAKTHMKATFTLMFICLYGQLAFSQQIFSVIDYGYRVNSRENAVPAVQKALQACRTAKKPVLYFPKGRYDFWPQYCQEKIYYESNTTFIPKRICPILIDSFKNITLDGQGSQFIFHGKMQPITVDRCENVLLQNITIDWDVTLTAQARVMDMTDNYMDVSINTLESPYQIENGKLFFTGEGWKSQWSDAMEFDGKTQLIAPATGDESCLGLDFWDNYKAVESTNGVVRILHRFSKKPTVGNVIVMRHSEREHAGTFIVNSKNVRIENLRMYHSDGLGILSQYSENLSFRNVHCVPNESKGRFFCGHDDGMHFSGCKGQIIIDSCQFRSLMDDPINVHGTNVQIVGIEGSKLVCKFMQHQSFGFTWANLGDSVGFLNHETMNTLAFGQVATCKILTPFMLEVTFKNKIPSNIRIGDALENVTWAPNVHIKNSFFGSNRARGILVSTPGKVLIENNIFESSGSAILIAGDANYWFESGAVKNVTIKNNRFNAPCLTSMYQFSEAIISILPEIPKCDVAQPFHCNIRIENNSFNPYDYPILFAKSTEGLYFNNNSITRSTLFKPFHARKQMITLEACKKVEILGNTTVGNVLGKNIKLITTPAKYVKLDKSQKFTIEN
jgi:pectate lyase